MSVTQLASQAEPTARREPEPFFGPDFYAPTFCPPRAHIAIGHHRKQIRGFNLALITFTVANKITAFNAIIMPLKFRQREWIMNSEMLLSKFKTGMSLGRFCLRAFRNVESLYFNITLTAFSYKINKVIFLMVSNSCH